LEVFEGRWGCDGGGFDIVGIFDGCWGIVVVVVVIVDGVR
jgi:hypothetical protein